MNSTVKLIVLLMWVSGIVLAKGFGSTFFAIIMPLWAHYLTIEHFLKYFGII